jgi:trigger factor
MGSRVEPEAGQRADRPKRENGRSIMQVTETLAEGLKREYRVVVPVAELDAKVNERLTELKDRVRINGFRPGKVPVAHLKRVYGRAAMREVIEETVREANTSIISDHGFRLATDPQIQMPESAGSIGDVVIGKADLAYSVKIEILPKFELADFKDIQIERPVAEVTDEEVHKAIDKIAKDNLPYSDKGEGAHAENGDKVTISFTGTIDGQPFEGGKVEDVAVVLGSGTLIPGFEDQLIGMALGESRLVQATFPDHYQPATLAGKQAEFNVTANTLQVVGTVHLDDDFAKSLGIESFDKLKELARERLSREHAAATRLRVKRLLLDALEVRHHFELPPTLVEQEFANVWRTLLADLESQRKTFADEGTTEEAARAEYHKIAERRVRLGLVIAEIGERNGIKVTDDEISRAIVTRSQQFPGQEQQIWEYYRKNPAALASVRAPIYEEKVVDFLLELVKVTDKTVTVEELFKEED